MMSQGPHHAVPLTQAQIVQQQQAQAHASEMAKRRSRKPTDKNMPDGAEDWVIGDGVARYKDLRDFERRLDATMTRKRLDIVDSVSRNAKVRLSYKPLMNLMKFPTIADIRYSATRLCEYGSVTRLKTKRGKATAA